MYLMSLAVLAGPSLKFHTAAVVALCGAHFAADVDGEPVPFWQSFAVDAGSTLAVGAVSPSPSCSGLSLMGLTSGSSF